MPQLPWGKDHPPSLSEPPAGASPHRFPCWNQFSSLLNLGGAVEGDCDTPSSFPKIYLLESVWEGSWWGQRAGNVGFPRLFPGRGSQKNLTGTAAPLEGGKGEMEGTREQREFHPNCSTRAGWQLQQTPKPTRTDVSWFHTHHSPE